MEVLRSDRVGSSEGMKESPRAEDDDDLDNELSHLEEAERAMRDELAAAVMEFGLTLPPSPTTDSAFEMRFDAPEEGMKGQGRNDQGRSEEDSPSQVVPESQRQQLKGFSTSTRHTASKGSPEKTSSASPVGTEARSQADMIDERELYAALTDLCQWIREGDSLKLQHRQEKQQATSISTPHRRHEHSPVKDDGELAVRRPVPSVAGTTKSARRKRLPTGRQREPPNLRELEKNLPVDELCRWLNEGPSPDCAESASPISQTQRRNGNLSGGSEPINPTPSTFHVHSVTGTSSLLVFGSAAAGNTVRAPKGRSPLRKTHC